jgi:hypothetical protein
MFFLLGIFLPATQSEKVDGATPSARAAFSWLP